MKYYLYRHVRSDLNQVFYIGIGTKHFVKTDFKSIKSEYKRAYETEQRTDYWKNVYNKTNVDVEIIYESNDYSFIKQKEREFIKLYGRKDLGLGTLVNFLDGGEGTSGWIASDKTKKQMSKNSSLKGKFGSLHHLSKKIYVYNIEGFFVKEFGGYNEAGRELNIDRANIKQVLDGKVQQCYGYIFFNEYRGYRIFPIKIINKKIRKVASYNNLKELVRIYETITLAAEDVKTQTTNISKACKNEKSKIKGFYWKYYS
jgi:hypothetical protein